MIFKVSHLIRYAYSAPVFLEPHMLRIRPRCDASQQVRNFTLVISPQPAGRHDFLDPEGNSATCLWFEEKTASLSITASSETQTFCDDPFSFLVTDDDFLQMPVSYKDTDGTALQPCLGVIETGGAVEEFGKSVVAETRGGTLDFLSRLCTVIYEDYTVEIRDEGLPLPPAVVIRNKRGACRDLTVLYMAVCRSMGLAARFVSGYQEGDQDMEQRHLHAWAEVYVPGGGWRGYDPTLGLTVADRHIIVAASHDPAGALPVIGTFRKTGVTANMDFLISLSTGSGS